MLRLEKVTGKNVWSMLKLHVAQNQESFVASNDISMIEAYTAITGNGYAFPFGIYEDDTPVFCISLKAGGTGLNLTGADMVIHYDPWWNGAVENQATDRAHRIGQKQVVTVYKLIMKGTLEEKILKLQERKAQLSDEIISEGRIQNTLASREELLEILRSPL